MEMVPTTWADRAIGAVYPGFTPSSLAASSLEVKAG